MSDLPELPFEQILSYLSVEDLLRSRTVSWSWYHRINSFRVKSLCFSRNPWGIFYGKRLIRGAFSQNLISCARFASFFNTFGQTILSNVKHLSLCVFDLNRKDRLSFPNLLNSFGQLEELEIIYLRYHPNPNSEKAIELNLPMLHSIHLEEFNGITRLTLDALRLKRVELTECSNLRLDLVHAESVERLLVDRLENMPMKKLKSLKQLYIKGDPATDPTLLSELEQLKEVHLYLDGISKVPEFFEQKQRYGRADLKIYFHGLLLNGADDPAIGSPGDLLLTLLRLAENPSRIHLADEIPFIHYFHLHEAFESVTPALAINFLKRFTALKRICIGPASAENVQGSLELLKNLDNIAELQFSRAHQELFDRLPAYSVIQWLAINGAPADFQFLFRLKNLVCLYLDCSVEAETVGKLLEELQFLWIFEFKYGYKKMKIEADANAVVQFLLKLHRKNGKL